MTILESEVFYNYTTFFTGPILNNDLLTKIILLSGMTELVFNHENKVSYIENGRLIDKELEYDISPKNNEIHFDMNGWPEKPYLKEMLFQDHLEIFLKKFFNLDANRISYNFVRFRTEPFYLLKNGKGILLYPTCSIYDSGIISVEFRRIIDSEIEIDEFIDSCVNASLIEYDKYYGSPLIKKVVNDSVDDQELFELDTIDFKFNMIEVDSIISGKLTITNLALSLLDIIVFGINGFFQKNRKFKKINFSLGNFWVGIPHIHILKFTNQKEDSSENMKLYQSEFNKILSRVNREGLHLNETISPKDLRVGTDYSIFIDKGISLVVWGLNGLNYQDHSLENNSDLVLSNQVITRYIDYCIMLYNRALEAVEHTNNFHDIIRYQKDIHSFNFDLFHNFSYGEHSDLFNYAYQIYDLKSFEKNLLSLIELKKIESNHKINNKNIKTGFFLTAVFGLFAAGNLSEDFIEPLFGYFLKIPQWCLNFTKIIFWIISVLFISIIVFIGYKTISKKANSK